MSLAEEIEQRRPFSCLQEEAVLSVFVTWDLLSRNLQRILRSRGLSLAQYNVLRILRGAGDKGVPLMTIARRMIVLYPNITRLTDRLETVGWIYRQRCTEDRRIVRAFVSPAGVKLLESLDAEVEELNKHLMRGVGVEDLHTLIAILEAVRKPLRAEATAQDVPECDSEENGSSAG